MTNTPNIPLVGYLSRATQYTVLIGSLLLPVTGRAEGPSQQPANGGKQPLEEKLVPEVPPAQSFCERHDCVNDIGALAALSLFGVSVGLHYKARGEEQELGETCGSHGGCSRADIDRVNDRYKLADYLALGAGALFTAVVVRGFVKESRKKTDAYTITPTANGVGVHF